MVAFVSLEFDFCGFSLQIIHVAKHYANMSVQYTAIFHGCKNDNFQMIFFSYFCSKHRLWVHVRTASVKSMFWSKTKKTGYACKPKFYFIKVGCKGVFVTRTCFRDVYLFSLPHFSWAILSEAVTHFYMGHPISSDNSLRHCY